MKTVLFAAMPTARFGAAGPDEDDAACIDAMINEGGPVWPGDDFRPADPTPPKPPQEEPAGKSHPAPSPGGWRGLLAQLRQWLSRWSG